MRVKLEGLSAITQAPGQLVKAVGTGAGLVGAGVLGAGAAGADVVTSGVSSGMSGVFSLGKGFRDFILKGSVVELAVAVVLGTAFTSLIEAVTADWITPLIGAMFGSDFEDLSFYVNGSRFNYGDFINALVVFLIVLMVLYFFVVLPLEKLQYAAFKHKAIMRDCPYCLEEISMAATRCKHCCAALEIDEEMQAAIDLATAALNEADKKQGCMSRLMGRCMKPRGTLVRGNSSGAVQLEAVAVDTTPLASPKSAATMMASRSLTRSRTGGSSGRAHSGVVSPTASSQHSMVSFHSPAAGTPDGGSTPTADYVAGVTATATPATHALSKQQQQGLRQ